MPRAAHRRSCERGPGGGRRGPGYRSQAKSSVWEAPGQMLPRPNSEWPIAGNCPPAGWPGPSQGPRRLGSGGGSQGSGAGALVDGLDAQGACGGPEMRRVVVAALVGEARGLPGQLPGRPFARRRPYLERIRQRSPIPHTPPTHHTHHPTAPTFFYIATEAGSDEGTSMVKLWE
jgi:hypothetical protein